MATEEPELGLYRYNVYGNEVEGQLTKEHAERIGAVPLGDESTDTGDAASTTGSSTGTTAKAAEEPNTKARTTTKNK